MSTVPKTFQKQHSKLSNVVNKNQDHLVVLFWNINCYQNIFKMEKEIQKKNCYKETFSALMNTTLLFSVQKYSIICSNAERQCSKVSASAGLAVFIKTRGNIIKYNLVEKINIWIVFRNNHKKYQILIDIFISQTIHK